MILALAATLAFGYAGSAVASSLFVGSSLAASVGWSIGSLIGSSLFAPEQPNTVISGPRLEDRRSAVSNIVGKPINIVFGTDRVFGSIISASDKREEKSTTTSSQTGKGKGGGGKSGPTTTQNTYNYYQTFAVAVGEGVIDSVRKIYANKTLIYDEGGSIETVPWLTFTFYTGSETQTPDPTLESLFGIGKVPAYRGLSYIVFDDYYLGSYSSASSPITFEFEVVTSGNTSWSVQDYYTETSTNASYLNKIRIAARNINGRYYLFNSPGVRLLDGRTLAIVFNPSSNSVETTFEIPTNIDTNLSFPAGSAAQWIDIYGNFVCAVLAGDSEYYWMLQYDSQTGLLKNYWLSERYIHGTYYDRQEINSNYKGILTISLNGDGEAPGYKCRIRCILPASQRDAASFVTGVPTPANAILRYFYCTNFSAFYPTADNPPIGVSGTVFDMSLSIQDRLIEQRPGVTSINLIGNNLGVGYIDNILATDGSVDYTAECILYKLDYVSLLGTPSPPSSANELRVIEYWKNTLIGDLAIVEYQGLQFQGDSGSGPGLLLIRDFGSDSWTEAYSIPSPRDYYYNEQTNTLWIEDSAGTSNAGFYRFDLYTKTLTLINSGITFTDFVDSGPCARHLNILQEGNYIYTLTYPYQCSGGNGADEQEMRLLKWKINNTSPNVITLDEIVDNFLDRCAVPADGRDTTKITDIVVDGYSLSTLSTGRTALDNILPYYFVDGHEGEWLLKFVPQNTKQPIELDISDFRAVEDLEDSDTPLYTLSVPEELSLPKSVSIRYKSPELAYQPGHTLYTRDSDIVETVSEENIEIPLVIHDDKAPLLAKKMLSNAWIQAKSVQFTVPKKYSNLEPTDIIFFRVFNTNRLIYGKITEINYETNKFLEVTATTEDIAANENNATSYVLQQSQQIINAIFTMYLNVLDTPPIYTLSASSTSSTSAYIYSNPYIFGAIWPGGVMHISQDSGITYSSIETYSVASTSGKIYSIPSQISYSDKKFDYNYIDNVTKIIVTLYGGKSLYSSTDAEFLPYNRNLLGIYNTTTGGWELIQFKNVTQLTPTNFEISGLVRGKFGTENHMTSISEQSMITLIEPDITKQTLINSSYIASNVLIGGTSYGQNLSTIYTKEYTYEGNYFNPRIGANGTAAISGSDIVLNWTFRGRFPGNYPFANLLDVREEYDHQIEVYDSTNTLINTYTTTNAETWTYSAANISSDSVTTTELLYFRVRNYSAVKGYNHSEYQTIYYAPDSLLYNLSGAPIVHYDTKKAQVIYQPETSLVDSSGNNNTATMTVGNFNKCKSRKIKRLSTRQILNSILKFGDGEKLVSSSTAITNANNGTVVVTFRVNEIPTATSNVYALVTPTNGNPFTLGIRSASTGSGTYFNAYTAFASINTVNYSRGEYTLVLVSAPTYYKVFMNGTLILENLSASTKYVNGITTIGDSTNLVGWDIDIEEVILYNTALTDAEIAIVSTIQSQG